MACYDIFRTDGQEIQQEWIKHVKQVDNRLEQILLEFYAKKLNEFAVSVTG